MLQGYFCPLEKKMKGLKATLPTLTAYQRRHGILKSDIRCIYEGTMVARSREE